MKKGIVFFSLVLLVLIISSFSNTKKRIPRSLTADNAISTVLTEEEAFIHEIQIPFVGNAFIGFREAVGFKESQGKYHIVNTFGYLGKYQFGKSTLKRFSIYDTASFLKDPSLQEDAFLALCSLNKWILRKDIRRSVGKTMNGTLITESGILAAAHLAGAGNVKKYLRSNGSLGFKDAYGSSVNHYLKKFSGYDTSFIEASRTPEL